MVLLSITLRDHPFKTSAFFRGEGSKIMKICRRLKWMVPYKLPWAGDFASIEISRLIQKMLDKTVMKRILQQNFFFRVVDFFSDSKKNCIPNCFAYVQNAFIAFCEHGGGWQAPSEILDRDFYALNVQLMYPLQFPIFFFLTMMFIQAYSFAWLLCTYFNSKIFPS